MDIFEKSIFFQLTQKLLIKTIFLFKTSFFIQKAQLIKKELDFSLRKIAWMTLAVLLSYLSLTIYFKKDKGFFQVTQIFFNCMNAFAFCYLCQCSIRKFLCCICN